MSLINKMLNDLEGRQALLSGSQDAVLDDLCAVSEEELGSHAGPGLRRGTALLFAILIVIFTVFFLNTGVDLPWQGPGDEAPPSLQADAPPVASGAGVKSGLAVENPRERTGDVALKLDAGNTFLPVAGEDSAVRPAGMVIQSVDLKDSGNQLKIEMGLPRETKYLIYTLNDPDRLVLELNNSRYNGPLPDINSMKGVHAVRQRVGQDGTYRLVVETDRQMRIDSAGIARAQSGYSLRVNVATAEPAAAATAPAAVLPAPAVSKAGTISISPVATDGVEQVRVADEDIVRIDRMVYEARKLYREGEVNAGLNKLLNAVKRAPDNVSARSTLAVLLFEQGQGKLATYILNEGLRKHPHQPEWTKILARALYSEGQMDKALALLEEAPPPVKGHLEYHALYAGILQEKGEHARAAVVYRNLLRYQPSNGAWWMGLAISLEAMSRKNDAIIAYRNALNTPQLNSDSLQYVKDRLNLLKQKS